MKFECFPLASALLLAGMLSLGPVQAAPAAVEGSSTVLVVTGKPLQKASLKLDMAALARLPQHSFRTNSPWTKAPQSYTGPLLRDVLALAGAGGTAIKALALNDYQVTIPMEDAQKYDVIVAHQIDGQPIPIRARGPLFVIYPFDSKAELQNSRYYDRSIWQLKSLRIE